MKTITRIVFYDQGDFAATHAAEAWCKSRGISCGSMQRDEPRGLLHGEFCISKWRNLSLSDRAELDGRMIGEPRFGPVTIELYESETE